MIDPDALDALFEPTEFGARQADGRVTVTYCGRHVDVHSDGTVSVDATR